MPDSLVEQHVLRIPRLTTERLVLRSFEESRVAQALGATPARTVEFFGSPSVIYEGHEP